MIYQALHVDQHMHGADIAHYMQTVGPGCETRFSGCNTWSLTGQRHQKEGGNDLQGIITETNVMCSRATCTGSRAAAIIAQGPDQLSVVV
jgi:hypothetical protein